MATKKTTKKNTKNQTSKKAELKRNTIGAVVAIIFVFVMIVLFFASTNSKPKYDMEKIISSCGFSAGSTQDSAYVTYDKERDALAFNAQLLWIYLFATAAKNDFNFSNPPKGLCPLEELGLLDNKQFLGEFVTRLDENKDVGFSEVYSNNNGSSFIITYDPTETINVTESLTKNDLSFQGKLYIKEKLSWF